MSTIKIYSRVRPTAEPFSGLQASKDGGSLSIDIGFHDNICKRPQSRYSQAPPSSHQFKFSRVFDQATSQEEVFEHVAHHMIDSFLSGYNGTIFAYGQTSSGKTYTIEGSSRSYAERGLIPRTISYVFEDVERRRGMGEDVTVHVSYMEIYQDMGYDLLNPGTRPGALMVTLPKVQVIEGAAGEVLVRNLSVHLAATEEVALSLLFQGSTCRRVAETSMNQRSSRSHTIFTLSLRAKSPGGEATIVKSKLHLVDLAGSERVAKTGADGLILQEAKHINLSLHHLEHVIVSLQQITRYKRKQDTFLTSGGDGSGGCLRSPLRTGQSRQFQIDQTPSVSGLTSPTHSELVGGHVPYRNSMLTMVLRDSLGGNCLTAMIATISAEERNIWESVSTCRFSQRVACISNQAKRNEELDDKIVIKRLKKKVAELEAELEARRMENTSQTSHLVNGDAISVSPRQFLSSADQKVCHKILNDFFHGTVDNPVQAGINTTAKFQECLFVMKEIVLHALGIQKQHQQLSNKQEATRTRSRGDRKHHGGDRKHHGGDRKHQKDRESMSLSSNGEGQGEIDVVDLEVSPESQSRLSSGFGSLQDEGSSGRCTDGCSQRVSRRTNSRGRKSRKDRVKSEDDERDVWHCHPQAWTSSSQSPPAASTDSQDGSSSIDQFNIHTMPPSASMYSTATSMVQTPVTPYSHMPSSSDKSQHIHKYSLMRRSPSTSKRRDSRERTDSAEYNTQETQEKTRRIKHIELRQSQDEENRLQQRLHRANLELQGQEMMDTLGVIGEKLAIQHALVKRLEKNGSSNPDDVRAEKIVEQQLRVKQAKLHHKLQSIQQELSLKVGDNNTRNNDVYSSNRSPSSSIVSSENEPTLENTRSHNREEQLRVEEALERLRMSRKEKELQLKEATTRMKIRALKQQLMDNGTHLEDSAGPALPGGTAAKVYNEPHPQYINGLPAGNHNQSEDKQHFMQQAYQILAAPDNATPPSAQAAQNLSTKSSSYTNSISASPTSLITPPQTTTTLPKSTFSNKNESVHDGHTPPVSPTALPFQKDTSLSHPHIHPAPISPPTQQASIILSSDKSSAEVIPVSTWPKVQERLTLPEELKETEYMSAVQKQKVRVNRIRRCIIAATVIQRAWRRHHRKHS